MNEVRVPLIPALFEEVLIDTLFSLQNCENCLLFCFGTVLLRVLYVSRLVQVVL